MNTLPCYLSKKSGFLVPTLEVATTQSDPLSKRWNMPFWSSTCHSDSKEYFLLFTSKGFKINELHNWEYEIFEILLWLKPSWNHGVSMVLQKAEAETNGMRQCPHVARPLAPLRSIETCVWHYCELVPQPTCSATRKLPLIYLLSQFFSVVPSSSVVFTLWYVFQG